MPDVLREIDKLEAVGVEVASRLKVSDAAPVILPYHAALDLAREAKRGEAKIGTTGKGIGPAYEDKVARRAIRVADLPNLLSPYGILVLTKVAALLAIGVFGAAQRRYFIDRMTRAHQLLTAAKVKKLKRVTTAEMKAARKQA